MRFWHLALLLVEGAVSLTFTMLDPEPQKMRGTVVNTAGDTVVVCDLYDRSAHTGHVSPATVITRDGKSATLTDIKAGDFVQMSVGSTDSSRVTSIEAQTPGRPTQRSATTRHR